jgi:phosphatidylserine/phosphatidylglycerophosphate/cardiolipin synthase-like enzyme
MWGGGRVTKELAKMLRSASETVIIQSPYVVVNRRSRRLFRAMRKDAPNLRIMVSTNSFGAADHLVTYSANYRLRGKVIGGLGFEIYEFKPHPEDLLIHLPNYEELVQRAEAVALKRKPYVSIHAKSYVVDDRIAFVGSYNLDPRSFYINNENGFIVEDPAFVKALKEDILRDMAPGNSWVVAERDRRLSSFNRQMERLWSLSPIDLWPLRNTTSFELIPGKEPVPPGHEDFYQHYRDIGSFPGSQGLTTEQVLTRFMKVTGKAATPLL